MENPKTKQLSKDILALALLAAIVFAIVYFIGSVVDLGFVFWRFVYILVFTLISVGAYLAFVKEKKEFLYTTGIAMFGIYLAGLITAALPYVEDALKDTSYRSAYMIYIIFWFVAYFILALVGLFAGLYYVGVIKTDKITMLITFGALVAVPFFLASGIVCFLPNGNMVEWYDAFEMFCGAANVFLYLAALNGVVSLKREKIAEENK